jgi:hypothetical protein
VLDIDHRADIYRRSLRLVGGPDVRLPGPVGAVYSVTANLPLLQTLLTRAVRRSGRQRAPARAGNVRPAHRGCSGSYGGAC